MTPCRITTKRIAVMPTSRTSTTIVTHHGSSPRTERPTNAIPIRALSAIGSLTLPKSVTIPRARAMSPSIRSVMLASTKTPAARMR